MSPTSSSTKPVIYKPVGFDDFPPLISAAAGDFVFNHSPVPLDDGPAYIDSVSGATLTRKMTYDLALKLGYGAQTLGVSRGKGVVMIFSPNSLAWPIVFLGLQSACILTTLANVSYTASELAHQITDSGATQFFVHPSVFPTLVSTLSSLGMSEQDMKKRVVIMSYTSQDMTAESEFGIGQEWTRLHELLQRGSLAAPIKLSGKQTDETTMMCYSGGTTGRSKGVETTHRNLVSIPQTYRPIAFPIDRSKDVEMGFLPLYHNYGIIKVLFFGFWIGVPILIVPKYEPIRFFQLIEQYKVSIIRLVPPVLVVLANHPAFDQYDLSSMKYMQSGAAPLGRGLLQRVKDRFSKQGANVTIIQGYGLTETSTTSHMLPVADEMRKIGSAGVLVPCLEARIVDDDGNDVPPGQGVPGELWMRGPTIMKGYLNNPKATKESITKEGWFKSGDVAVRDDEGYYYIVDRKKELIKYKGFQVPPADLEAILLTKDNIADCGVIGIDDPEQATELPRAYVVPSFELTSPAAIAAFEAEVQEWIKPRVARHKWLRGGVKVVKEIPKTPSGKILRRELREASKLEERRPDTTVVARL